MVAHRHSSVNVRWANNTVTTNGAIEQVSVSVVSVIGRRVASFGTRVVLTQEGGYLRGYSALCLHSLVEGLLRLPEPLLEDPLAYVPDDTQLVDADFEHVRRALKPFWPGVL